MISFQLDPSAELVKTYLPPFKGTWKTLPSHLLPDDVLQDSLNVTLLSGKLRSRCGIQEYDATVFDNYIRGSFIFIDPSNTKYPLVSSLNKLYKYNGTSFADITGATVLTGTSLSQVRMTSIQIGINIYLIYCNNSNTLKYAQNAVVLQDIIPNTGSIPICKDICNSYDRIIGITPPYTVQWCDIITSSYLSFTAWPALNQAILSQTEDSLIAIRPLGTLNFAVYKEGNIFVAIAQSGPASQAFRFEHRGEYEGPGGVNAIVSCNGLHIYMTPTGRIATFDGSTHTWIADGLWPFLQDDLDPAYAYRIHGCYNYKTSEIYFWYPRVGDNGEIKGMVILNTPYPTAGINTYSYFIGLTSFSVSNSLSVRLFNSLTSPLVFTTDTKKTYYLNKDYYLDKGLVFSCSFSTGLFKPISPLQQGKVSVGQAKDISDIYRPVIEPYFTRDDTRGLVNITALTSDLLADNGLESTPDVVDLTQLYPNQYHGFNDTGSFLGFKAEWDSNALVEYKGADIYGRRTT